MDKNFTKVPIYEKGKYLGFTNIIPPDSMKVISVEMSGKTVNVLYMPDANYALVVPDKILSKVQKAFSQE